MSLGALSQARCISVKGKLLGEITMTGSRIKHMPPIYAVIHRCCIEQGFIVVLSPSLVLVGLILIFIMGCVYSGRMGSRNGA